MWIVVRMMMAVAVVLMPGGFPLLWAMWPLRTLWRVAERPGRAQPRPPSLAGDVVASLHFRELVREARAAL